MEVLYTTVIFSLSFGFLAMSILAATVFMQDRTRFHIPGLVLLSIVLTFLIERPSLAFAPLQFLTVPLGSALAFGLFFYIINIYTKKNSPS